MIPVAFKSPRPSSQRPAPIAMTVLSRRSGHGMLPVQVFAAVVAARPDPDRRAIWTVLAPTQILDYLDAARG